MPIAMNVNTSIGIPKTKGPQAFRAFGEVIPIFEERNYTISGITKDLNGAALGGCTVRLFNTATNVNEQTTVSDASGNYAFIVDKTQVWYCVSYKTGGATDVAGTTLNTLTGG